MKKSTFLILLACTLFLSQLKAQSDDTTYWRKDFRAGVNFNQASFSDNWTGGGVNSIGLNTFLNYKADYSKGVSTWDSEIDLAYGVIKNKDQTSRKSADRIFLDTKYGRKLADKWNLATSLSLHTQFAIGYSFGEDLVGLETRTKISNLFAPGFLTSAWGLEYKPANFFSVRVAPFSPRLTFVSDDDLANTPSVKDPTKGAYGVDLGDNLRTEWLAFQLLANFNKDIAKNLNLKWKYIMYANYEELSGEKMDHRLDMILSAKVNNFMDVSLGAIMIYDFDQINEVQFNQALNIGIVYVFKNYTE